MEPSSRATVFTDGIKSEENEQRPRKPSNEIRASPATTLRRAAEALGCSVAYVLIPNKPLETTIRERARAFLRRRLLPVEHTMLLEDQQVAEAVSERQIDDIIRETNPRLFWD